MPFELGLAVGLKNYKATTSTHSIILLESVHHRLSRTLSDMAGFDPAIHEKKPLCAISCILDTLGSGTSDPEAPEVHRMWRQLMKAAHRLKTSADRDDLYSTTLFKGLVVASAELSQRFGFIRP